MENGLLYYYLNCSLAISLGGSFLNEVSHCFGFKLFVENIYTFYLNGNIVMSLVLPQEYDCTLFMNVPSISKCAVAAVTKVIAMDGIYRE